MQKTGKLELTWVGKYDSKNIEPRILVEDKSKSYGDPNSENMLIHGDNLIALQSLQQDYSGMIKCIYIDPPFNTGAAFEHYDDSVEHSIWLDLMRRRFELLFNLLSDDGCIFVNLDDSESAYCKIILDEVFGRANYLNEIIVATNKSFGFKSTSDGIFKQANHLLFYAKNKDKFSIRSEQLYIEKGYDTQYKWEFYNTDAPEDQWKWRNINDVVAKEMGYTSVSEAKKDASFEINVANYAIENADRVFRTASVSGGALLKRKETIAKSKKDKTKIIRHPNDDMDYMFIGGERVLYYKERLRNIDGVMVPAELITDIWLDISVEGLAAEGSVDFPKGKKPEKLIKRCIELTTNEGDFVLDSFLGSGTTAAVANKMNRRWIGIELGDHAYTHCKVRLDKVVDGEQSGISKSVNWQGGGGYHFYELAPSLLVKNDKLPIFQINPSYTFEMLCEAICKIEGFHYKPQGVFHGYSSEKRFIHVTTEFINAQYIKSISSRLTNEQSLLVYGTKVQSDMYLPDNVEVKKLPKDLLDKCDFESEVR
ncbi:MAG: site-specific DNA-methyltransferase [Aeriscardovia sp.]|nr:site-specific DNA-methyltransferase [Aeriscardovia sp.]